QEDDATSGDSALAAGEQPATDGAGKLIPIKTVPSRNLASAQGAQWQILWVKKPEAPNPFVVLVAQAGDGTPLFEFVATREGENGLSHAFRNVDGTPLSADGEPGQEFITFSGPRTTRVALSAIQADFREMQSDPTLKTPPTTPQSVR